MKRSILVAGLALMIFGGCSNANDGNVTGANDGAEENRVNNIEGEGSADPEDELETPIGEDDELQSVVAHFDDAGYDMGEQAFKAYEMVGAAGGFGIEVDGSEIEFYLYEEGATELDALRTEGQFDMDGFTVLGELNDRIAMMAHEDHPDREGIVATFHGYE